MAANYKSICTTDVWSDITLRNSLKDMLAAFIWMQWLISSSDFTRSPSPVHSQTDPSTECRSKMFSAHFGTLAWMIAFPMHRHALPMAAAHCAGCFPTSQSIKAYEKACNDNQRLIWPKALFLNSKLLCASITRSENIWKKLNFCIPGQRSCCSLEY